MKKITALLVVFSFGLLFTTPLTAQRPAKFKAEQTFVKVPVKYKSINAFSDGNGVWLEWETSLESGNIGFNIYRSNGIDKELISPSLIPGGYLKSRNTQTTSGEKYTFFDADGDYNSSYYIETFNINGQKRLSDSVAPKFVGDLTEVAGSSSASLKNAYQASNTFISSSKANLPEEMKAKVNKTLSRTNAAKQYFVAAQPGVKIGVKKEGFYRVTRDELKSAGFNVVLPSTNWQLYKNGVEQSINVGASGAYIEFYGTELDTKDTDTQIYFLINGAENGKRIEPIISRTFGGRGFADSFSQTTSFKERTIYTARIRNGDDVENFFGRVITATPAVINLDIQAIDLSAAIVSVDLKIQGLTQVAHQTKVVLNDVEIGVIDGNSDTSMSKKFDVPTSGLREGANVLKLTAQGGSSDVSLFDTVKVNYSKLYKARQNQLSFSIPSYKEANVDGFTSSNVRVFDITDPDQPKIANFTVESNNSGGYRVYLPPNRARAMFGVEDSALLSAASITANSPSFLSNSANSASMIIISYKDWMSQANDWADYRRNQGMSVEVVNIEDVFDEFSFGAFSSDAIKDYLKYAYDNRQTKPEYVLLIGDATYNPRNYTNLAVPPVNYNFVPTKMVETIYIETGSDEALADFNNNGLATIPIGRIPAHDAQSVTNILNKVDVYEQSVATRNLNRGMLFASDLPNGYDFAGVNNRLRSQLPADTPSVMINKADTDARTRLLAEMNNGKFLINYSGHGNVSAWSASPTFFGNTDVSSMTNGNNLTIFTLLTCLNGYFIQTQDSLAEVLLNKQTGGAVAVWASSGETTPDVQEIMATRFFNKIGGDNTMRLGDLIKDAKTTIPGGRDVRLSWALIGDPALKVR